MRALLVALMMQSCSLMLGAGPGPQVVPPVSCRIVQDGKVGDKCPVAETHSVSPLPATCLKWDNLSGWRECGPQTKSEAMDVPATRTRTVFYCGHGRSRCDFGEYTDPPGQSSVCSYDEAAKELEKSCGRLYWTCESGSGRVLLTDIDGGKHCVSFKGR